MYFFSNFYKQHSAAYIKTIGILLASLLLYAVVEAGTISEDLISRNTEILDTDLVITAKSLLTNGIQADKFLLVDIRSSKAFKALHIPGSINIPLHFIKVKSCLKSSPMVLVDQGLSYYRLAPFCRNLREKGFDARILDGGMNAWSSHGGDMVGDMAQKIDFGSILSAEFFKEKDFHTRIVCDVSVYRSVTSLRLMPYALHLPLNSIEKVQAEIVEKFKKNHARNGASAILLVNANGKNYRGVQRLFDNAGCRNVFYLEGGVNAYEKYLEDLLRSWRPPNDRLASNDPCRECAN